MKNVFLIGLLIMRLITNEGWFNENRNDFEPSVYTISRLKDIFNNVISYTDDVINIEQFNPNIDQIKAFLNDALSTIADVYNEVVARHKSQEKELSHNRVKRFREKRRQEMQASPTYKVKY